jgi:hypothetical protein
MHAARKKAKGPGEDAAACMHGLVFLSGFLTAEWHSSIRVNS